MHEMLNSLEIVLVLRETYERDCHSLKQIESIDSSYKKQMHLTFNYLMRVKPYCDKNTHYKIFQNNIVSITNE